MNLGVKMMTLRVENGHSGGAASTERLRSSGFSVRKVSPYCPQAGIFRDMIQRNKGEEAAPGGKCALIGRSIFVNYGRFYKLVFHVRQCFCLTYRKLIDRTYLKRGI